MILLDLKLSHIQCYILQYGHEGLQMSNALRALTERDCSYTGSFASVHQLGQVVLEMKRTANMTQQLEAET